MPFKDVLVAGATLVRDAVQSAVFDVANGWQIKQDGSATFNNLQARGDIVFGSSGTSMTSLLSTVAATGFQHDSLGVDITTTNTYDDLCPLFYAYIKFQIQKWSPNIDPNTIFDSVTTCHVTFESSSSAGSGGHFNVAMVRNDGVMSGDIIDYRSGQDGGKKIVSMAWKDSFKYSDLPSANPVNKCLLRTKHTGATSYHVVGVVVVTHWRPRI